MSLDQRKSLLARLVGSTPTVPIECEETGVTIWMKLEYLLPSGSTKDRVAAHVLSHAVEAGLVTKDSIVVEASSGSTSIAFAMACAVLGVKFCAVMPEDVSQERSLMIRRFGGDIRFSPKSAGIVGAIEMTRAMATEDPKVFLPRQFENPKNALAHERMTALELMRDIGTTIHGFTAGVGTAGTLMGVARALREAGHPTRVVRVMPEKASACFAGQPEICGGIPGVVDGVSSILDMSIVDATTKISEAKAIESARALCRRGFSVGPSSGLNFAAATELALELGPGHTVATVACDRMERYFSTSMFGDIPR